MLNHWLLIILLALCTFLSRLIGVEFMAEREMNPTLRLYFNYVPVAIISALIIDQALSTTNGQTAISIPVVIACLAAAISIKKTDKFLPSLVIGIAIGLLARYFL